MKAGGSSFVDSSFMPAEENRRVLRDWCRFFRQGLQYRHFTRRLYEHLTRRCGFVVCRGRRGFYETYIEDPDGLLRFLDQFDRRAGCPSAETGSTAWLEGERADVIIADHKSLFTREFRGATGGNRDGQVARPE